MIARLIGGFVAILIGLSLIYPISRQINSSAAVASMPADSYGSTLLKLVPAFFALGVLGIGIAITWGALRSAGVVGGVDDRDGLEGKAERYNCTGNVTNDLYGSMDGDMAMAEVRRATEPPKYYKESQLREIEEKYKPIFNERKTKFDEENG